MKEQLTSILKIILVIVLVIGYFVFVHYDEFHKRKQGRRSQKELVVTSWWRLPSSENNCC